MNNKGKDQGIPSVRWATSFPSSFIFPLSFRTRLWDGMYACQPSQFYQDNPDNLYPDNKSFSWHAKNGEKRKTSEEIVWISCWVCAISRPRVWTSHTGQTGCVTGFSLSRHSRAWTVCISAGQNGAALSKWPEKRLGSSLVRKLHCVMLNRILTRYLQKFFFSLHFSRATENLCHQGG